MKKIYLAQDLVDSILMFRFGNMFESAWNNKYIEKIVLTITETSGSKKYGCLKDIDRCYLLGIIALVTLEAPKSLGAIDVQKCREDILKAMSIEHVILGKASIKNKHETYVALKIKIDNERWRGVNFFIKIGRYLNKAESHIKIKFSDTTYQSFKDRELPKKGNWFTLLLSPYIRFCLGIILVKESAISGPLELVNLSTKIEDIKAPSKVKYALLSAKEREYTTILLESINAEKPLYIYKKGSTGPTEAYDFFTTYRAE